MNYLMTCWTNGVPRDSLQPQILDMLDIMVKTVRIEIIFYFDADPYVSDAFQNWNWDLGELMKQVQPFEQGSSSISWKKTNMGF